MLSRDIPIIEMKIRNLGDQVNAALAMHHEDIEIYVTEGVERAVKGMADQIIEQAAQGAAQRIEQAIKSYFSYGAGARVIDQMIEESLAPFVAALQAKGYKS